MWRTIQRLRPEVFFIGAALVFQILILFLVPPLQSPDERNHFYKAYQVSRGIFVPEKTDHRLGGQLPYSFKVFSDPFMKSAGNEYCRVSRKDLEEAFALTIDDEHTDFEDFPNTAYYSPVSYVPQSLGLWIMHLFTDSVGALYYGGRVFVFLFWMLCMFYVIKLLPVYKWLFTVLILLPMNVYISNTFSADIMTNILCFFMIALTLRHMGGAAVTRRDVIILLALVLLLALAKVIYVLMMFLLLAVPAARFGSQRRRWTVLSLVFIAGMITAYVWSGVIMKYYISFADYNPTVRKEVSVAEGADYYLQKAYMKEHPLHFPRVIYNTFTSDPQFFLRSYIGGYGTYLHLFMPFWVVYLSYAFILLLALFEARSFELLLYQKLIFLGTGAGVLVLLLISQHLTWNFVGHPVLEFIQGRYLTPFFPLFFLLAGFSGFRPRLPGAVPAMLFVVLLNGFACYFLYMGFIKDMASRTTGFNCGAEEHDGTGFFVTSNPEIRVGGGYGQTDKEYHTGHYSAMLPPQAFSFSYQFKDLDFRDLVEVEAWQKGAGGVLVISGKPKTGNDFYFADKTIRYHKDGWNKLSMTFSVWDHYNGSDAAFYVFNTGPDTVFVDDVTVRIKKFKDVAGNLMPR